MKKIFFVIAAIFSMALIAAGCSSGNSPNMTMDITDNNALISLNKAAKNDSFTSGSLKIQEGEKVVLEPNLEGTGNVLIQLITESDEQTGDTIPGFNRKKIELEWTMAGSEPLTCSITPGSYTVKATAMSNNVTGSVQVNVINPGDYPYELWEKTNTAEDAAKKAGLNEFVLPLDAETDLGNVADSINYMNFRYQKNTVQADFPIAAVEMVIRKSQKTYAAEEISSGSKQFRYSWTQDVNDTVVTCFGSREGDASKIVWTAYDYGYCILATGAGGDDNFGLSENDVAIWVQGIR